MKTKSIKANSTEELSTELQRSMADGFHPTLAIVFVSIKHDKQELCKIITQAGIELMGATSAGEFIDGHQSAGGIVILLLDIQKDHYQILFTETKDKDISIAARETVDKAMSKFSNPAFILCSTSISSKGSMFDGDALVGAIQDASVSKAQIFGGMAGADGTLNGTYVFTGEESTDNGFVLLVLNADKIDLYGMAISGWKPVGKIRTVTKEKDGWIYTIDDQPALDMYLRYLGQSLQIVDDVHRDIGFFYPFLSIDAGAPSLRTPLMVDQEKKAIKLDFPMPQGKQLQFTLPPDFDIIETVLEKANALKHEKNNSVDALLIFSCYGRLTVLGPMLQQENEGLYKIWNAPMAGFCSYGEFGKDMNSDNVFHSTTCSWVALKEK